MAFPTCDLPTLNAAVPGSLQNLSDKQTQVLLVLYLYRQKNPSTVGQNVDAAALISQAKCFDCGVSDGQLAAFEVWIQRQAAIDAGAAEGAFSADGAMARTCGLNCLSMHRLKAIELLLRCQLS
jgi:hypothetical protein